MTSPSPANPAAIKSAVVFLLNAALCMTIGGVFFGPWGLLGGLLAWLCAALVPRLIRAGLARQTQLRGARRLGLKLLRTGGALIALPFVLVFTIAYMTVAHLWGTLAQPLRRIAPFPAGRGRGVARATGAFLRSFARPDVLPLTVANLLMILVIACVLVGIQVAFYVALAAVPVMILTLVMVAIDFSAEPEDDLA